MVLVPEVSTGTWTGIGTRIGKVKGKEEEGGRDGTGLAGANRDRIFKYQLVTTNVPQDPLDGRRPIRTWSGKGMRLFN